MSSEWKEGAVRRRDARHTKTPDEPGKGSPKPSKKDTKKWCRGKVGIEHEGVCKTYAEAKNLPTTRTPGVGWEHGMYKNWFILVCKNCGKELASYWGRKKNKPDWVKQ